MSTISDQIASLNEAQREVALCERHCLAIAAPGSGKTKTLAVKAAHVLERGQTVAAVTFTRDAAIELRDRILALSGKEALPRLLVGTFHSIDLLMAFPSKAKSGMGTEILSRGHSRLRQPWEIVKEGSRQSFVDRAIEQSGLDIERDEATRIIEGIKSGHVKPESEEQSTLVDAYRQLLKRHGVIDFQDILIETNRAMKTGDISPLRANHLMIDEFQDTDTVQFDWAMQHAQAGCVLTAVGDDDQSIYGFRRALGFTGMVDFKSQLDATRIVLGTNYRSHAEILRPSAALIAHNTDRMEKALDSFKGAGGVAWWSKYGSREREAEECHRWARAGLDAGKSVGVLARTNKRLDAVEAQCRRNNTPCIRAEGGSILRSREMAAFMAAMGLVTRDDMRDADEVLAWLRLSEEEIAGIHKVLGQRPFTSLDKAGVAKLPVPTDTRAKVSALLRLCADWKAFIVSGGFTYLVDGVYNFLATARADDKRSKSALEIVRTIFLIPKGGVDSKKQINDHLARLRDQMSNKDAKKKPETETPQVVLLTAHGSKGLEFDQVWMLGADQGSFPDDSASLQEERRLFFVGMTRARQNLMVSSAGAKPSSVFIDEAGLCRLPEEAPSSLSAEP